MTRFQPSFGSSRRRVMRYTLASVCIAALLYAGCWLHLSTGDESRNAAWMELAILDYRAYYGNWPTREDDVRDWILSSGDHYPEPLRRNVASRNIRLSNLETADDTFSATIKVTLILGSSRNVRFDRSHIPSRDSIDWK